MDQSYQLLHVSLKVNAVSVALRLSASDFLDLKEAATRLLCLLWFVLLIKTSENNSNMFIRFWFVLI